MKRLQGCFVTLMNALTDVRDIWSMMMDIASGKSCGNVYHHVDDGHWERKITWQCLS